MTPIWLEDVIEQICIARILRDSKTTSGRRLSMILIDNAVEFMIKVHGESLFHKKQLSLNRKDWEETKPVFASLVNTVLPHTPASSFQQEIIDYHSMRNALYHGTNPLSVEPKKINDYMDIACKLLELIFRFVNSEDEWKKTTESMQAILLPKGEKIELVSFSNDSDGTVRMQTSKTLADTDAILLMIYGITQETGKPPESNEQLEKCLNRSGQIIESKRLTVDISHLRTQKKIEKGKLALKSKGRDYVKKRYFFSL
jgi:hypothetical protein